jgi:hypothetical protein
VCILALAIFGMVLLLRPGLAEYMGVWKDMVEDTARLRCEANAKAGLTTEERIREAVGAVLDEMLAGREAKGQRGLSKKTGRRSAPT